MAHTLWHRLWEHKNNPFLATGKHQVLDPLNLPYRPGLAEEPPIFNPSGIPGRASLRQIAGDIGSASQSLSDTGVGGWPGQGRGETQEAQMARIRRGREGAHDYPMALSQGDFGMYGQAQKDVAAGKYAPEEEDDEMQKLLRYMFMSELMAGMAGGDPPTPYTVQAGPAARAFPTMPSM